MAINDGGFVRELTRAEIDSLYGGAARIRAATGNETRELVRNGVPLQARATEIPQDAVDVEKRTIALAFSSEEPYERYFGIEILDHGPGAVRTGRLKNKVPVCLDHWLDRRIGRLIDPQFGVDRVGRGTALLSRVRPEAEYELQDAADGIPSQVSVGYFVHKMVLVEKNENGPNVYRVTDWEPYEVSFVSASADQTVGVGRDVTSAITQGEDKGHEMPETKNQDSAAIDTTAIEASAHERGMKAERERRSEIAKISKNAERMLGAETVADIRRQAEDSGASPTDFLRSINERMGNEPAAASPAPVKMELSKKEERQYSVLRAMRLAAGLERDGGLERELSDEICKTHGATDGIRMPLSLGATRTVLEAGTDSLGGYGVPTVTGTLIDLLRKKMRVKQLGATVMSGLTSDLSFPRQDTAGTLYWTGETPGSDVTESNMTFGQVNLTPKTAQATQAYSRQMLTQSSFDVENLARNDLMKITAIGLDLAAINGSGSANQPRGILNVSGIGSVAGGDNGAAPTWDHMIKLWREAAVDDADYGSLGYLTNPLVIAKLMNTEKYAANGQYIVKDLPDMNGMTAIGATRCAVSNQVPSTLTKGSANGVCSAIIYGNWSDLMIGEFGSLELIADPFSQKKQGFIEITSFVMVDIAVRHPQSFVAMKDVLTT